MSAQTQSTSALTQDEAAVYDRQIRIWGLDAQNKLRNCRVLVIGIRALAAETCKNIVLAGIGSLTILDGVVVTEADLGAQFFLRASDIGQARSVASAPRINELNPNVKITADVSDVRAKLASNPEFFTSFDVVCVFDLALDLQLAINRLCHNANIPFFAGAAYGMAAFFFEDMGSNFQFQTTSLVRSDSGEDVEVKSKNDLSFPTLEESLSVPWNKLESVIGRRQKATIKLFCAWRLIQEFMLQHRNVYPHVEIEADLAHLRALRGQYASDPASGRLSAGSEYVDDAFLEDLVRGAQCQFAPVCAIVAGLLGNEVIKAITHDGTRPLINYVLFDTVVGSAGVAHIAP